MLRLNISKDLKKKLSHVVDKLVVCLRHPQKNKSKVNNLENKIPDVSALIQTTQYNTDKQNLERKKLEILIKEYLALVA